MTKSIFAGGLLPALLLLAAPAGPARAGLPVVPEGFKIRLVANVPAVVYPCQVATAPDGSVFIAEDPMDQVGPYESDHGKILILRDGKDPQVFAEGFRAIFGMAWRDGALYVSHMPYLTVLRDDDGDGKAESRTELFKDLGITDNKGLNDHIVSGIQFGIDGYLYISTGDKGIYRATGPDGRTAQIVGGGTLRCRPDGTGIEVLTTGTRNHLEPNLDAADNLFTYDNTDDGDGWWTRVTHHVDGGYYGYPYDYHDHPDRFLDRMAEYASGSPCGGIVYREDAWPESYRGRAIWAEWGKRAVRAFKFKQKGASFVVEDVAELAQPEPSGEFRPLDLALSYDGKTLYVADWGMGGWGNKSEKVGRVYAITYDGPLPPTTPRGSDSDPIEAQFAALAHPSYNERTRAQQAIIRKGREALGLAAKALADPATAPLAKRHLVWVVDGIAGGTPEADAPLMAALDDPVADVQAQAARALGERRRPGALAKLQGKANDFSPIVRLQVIIALGRIGDPAAVPTLLPILADGDRTLAFSARQALRRIGRWEAIAAGLNSPDAKVRAGVLAAMESTYDVEVLKALALAVGGGDATADDRARAVQTLATVHRKTPPWDGKWWGTRPTKGRAPARSIDWEGTPVALIAARAALSDREPAVRLAAVAAAREIDDPNARPTLRVRFAVDDDAEVRREIARTLGELKDAPAVPILVAAIRDPATPEPVRDAALSGVEAIGGPKVSQALVELLSVAEVAASDARQAQVIAALGRAKAKGAVEAIGGRLASPNPGVREAAARALGAIGAADGVAEKLRPLVADPAVPVRNAAIAAVAALKDRGAIPALISAANDEPTRYEAALALAALPDPRALQVYLRGVSDRSQDLRRASARAIAAIRDKAEPTLVSLAERRELPPSALPELRRIFNPLRPIAGWHWVGPFPIKERPPVPAGQPIDLAASIAGPDGTPLSWKPIEGDPATGMVDLEKILPGQSEKSVFAVATFTSETARPARLAVGSDDTLQVWLNGKDVYKFEGSRSFNAEESRVDVELRRGENRILVRCGNHGGPWAFAVSATSGEEPAFLAGPSGGGFDPDKFQAQAREGQGKADHGRELFFDLKGVACSKCHAVGGQGGAVGPDLSGVAAKYPREELIASVLYPSARISSGYEPTVVATADGRVFTGLVKSETADALEIEDADARRTRIPKADIEERKASDLSLMPNGLVEGISARDFADLIAYLETLKDAAANQGAPAPAP
ncbi:PVC-type heme-binding CxxCH protein [Tundrisphaera sp. TA3]|uniref:PVC-type heme-binding CxxCH protein n=1 Tax=Tundrisphaera sp. TA3 TaxID=3435775 RepID=UPI003EBA37B8